VQNVMGFSSSALLTGRRTCPMEQKRPERGVAMLPGIFLFVARQYLSYGGADVVDFGT
jgi:hypothetical protein